MSGERPRRSWPARLAPWALLAAALGVWAWSAAFGSFDYGRRVGARLGEFALEMASFLPAMFVLVGLFDVWVPRATVERHLGRGAGAAGVFWVVLLATLQAGPLYAAFPVAVALWRKGCTPANVFIYLGAFSAMKIPMLTFEVGFLGWQFSLARTALTLPVFIALGYLLERLLPPEYSVAEPAAVGGKRRG